MVAEYSVEHIPVWYPDIRFMDSCFTFTTVQPASEENRRTLLGAPEPLGPVASVMEFVPGAGATTPGLLVMTQLIRFVVDVETIFRAMTEPLGIKYLVVESGSSRYAPVLVPTVIFFENRN